MRVEWRAVRRWCPQAGRSWVLRAHASNDISSSHPSNLDHRGAPSHRSAGTDRRAWTPQWSEPPQRRANHFYHHDDARVMSPSRGEELSALVGAAKRAGSAVLVSPCRSPGRARGPGHGHGNSAPVRQRRGVPLGSDLGSGPWGNQPAYARRLSAGLHWPLARTTAPDSQVDRACDSGLAVLGVPADWRVRVVVADSRSRFDDAAPRGQFMQARPGDTGPASATPTGGSLDLPLAGVRWSSTVGCPTQARA